MVVAAGGGRERRRQREHQEREQAAPHRPVASFARATAASPGSPEAAAAGLASPSVVVPQVLSPFLPQAIVLADRIGGRAPGITPKGDSGGRIPRSGDQAGPSLYSRAVAELQEYRERFPILAETTYLINHSLGAMPAAAEERVLEYARTWKPAACAPGRRAGGICRLRSATRSPA